MPFIPHSGFNTHAEGVSAEDRQDLLVAVDFAIKQKMPGVQLYLNEKVFDQEYLQRLAAKINDSMITEIVIHLPNYDNPFIEQYLSAAYRLTGRLDCTVNVRTLIHYGYGDGQLLDADQVPQVGRDPVYIENSKTREFDRPHVLNAARLALESGSGFVFDIGRFAYPDTTGVFNIEAYERFVRRVIGLFTGCPEKLIIHTAGKTQPGVYRDFAVPHGHSQDIFKCIYPYLLEHHSRGGIIVFEAEKPEDVLQSIRFFERSAEG